jgi:hypothetical protein
MRHPHKIADEKVGGLAGGQLDAARALVGNVEADDLSVLRHRNRKRRSELGTEVQLRAQLQSRQDVAEQIHAAPPRERMLPKCIRIKTFAGAGATVSAHRTRNASARASLATRFHLALPGHVH